ncbi:amidase, partial [Bacillus sp. JJ1503]
GGSSSGSAAAVAACLSYGAIGTDAGGSIRLPASFCGIVGMKPTYGTVSKRGMYPISWIQDHVGPMTRTVHDNALILNAISGFDSEDPDAIYRKPEDFTRLIGKDIKGTSIGVPSNFYFEDLNEEISKKVEEAITILEALGVRITRVALPNIEKFLDAQRVILSSDAYAINREGLEGFPDLWDDEVKERLLTGRYIRGFEYATALQTRKLAKKEFNDVFEKVDVILTPTTSILPPRINERFIGNDQNAIVVRQIISKQTSPTNLNGFPSLALPCDFSSEGLPIGIQFIGKEWEEAKLYQFGYALEQELSLTTAKLNINHLP